MTAGHLVAMSAVRVSVGTVLVLFSSAAVTILAGSLFGATRGTDAYLIALAIPAVLGAVVSVAPANASIAVLVHTRAQAGPDAADHASRSLLWASVGLMALIGAAVLVFRHEIVTTLTPGFQDEARSLTAALLLLTVPATVFVAGATALGSALNARQQFFASAVAPAVTNVITFTSLLVAGHLGVVTWAAGYLAGTLTAFVLLILIAHRSGQSLRPVLELRTTWSRQIMEAAAPFVVLAIVIQASGLIVRQITSLLAAGTITALALALTLASLPLSLAAYSVGTALVPAFAESTGFASARFQQLYSRAVGVLATILVPASVAIVLCAEPIVRLLFQRGAFDTRATQLTADALRVFAIALVFEPLLVVSHRALLGTRATGVLFWVGSFQALLLMTLAIVLVGPFGHLGVAAAYTIAVAVNTLLLASVARLRLGLTGSRHLVRTYAVVAISALGAFGVAALGARFAGSDLLQLLITCGAGGVAYLGSVAVMDGTALRDLLRVLPGRRRGPFADEVESEVR